MYDWLLSHGNKRPRTQVNAIEDDSKEEEQEDGEQAIVQLTDSNVNFLIWSR